MPDCIKALPVDLEHPVSIGFVSRLPLGDHLIFGDSDHLEKLQRDRFRCLGHFSNSVLVLRGIRIAEPAGRGLAPRPADQRLQLRTALLLILLLSAALWAAIVEAAWTVA